MNCPICKIKLGKSIFYGVEVDYCPDCLGIWFEEDELRQAKDQKDEELNWFDIDIWEDKTKLHISYGERMCPVCRLPLYEVYYGDSGIIVDVCSICNGIWLDRGEFKKIIKHLKERSDFEILNNYVKNLTREGFEVFTGPEPFKDEVEDFISILKILNYKFAAQNPAIVKIISTFPK